MFRRRLAPQLFAFASTTTPQGWSYLSAPCHGSHVNTTGVTIPLLSPSVRGFVSSTSALLCSGGATDQTVSHAASPPATSKASVPQTTPPPSPCSYTRSELDELNEKHYGKPVWEAYFFKTDEPSKVPKKFKDDTRTLDDEELRCYMCGCTIAEHGVGISLVKQAQTGLSLADAAKLIDVSQMHQVSYTPDDLPFTGREVTMKSVEESLEMIRDPVKQQKINDGKGQPLLGTGATSGAGKSRLLEEIRTIHKERGARVINISYGSRENLGPKAEETAVSNLAAVEEAFLSRLLCMMMPSEEFAKATKTLGTFFSGLVWEGVADLIAEKCSGREVLILVDEVVTLSEKIPNGGHDDRALNRVVSVLGKLCDRVSSQLKTTHCIGFFTALSRSIIETAETASGRAIRVIELPLLTRDATIELVKAKDPTLSEKMQSLLFAISAGHARTLERFLLNDVSNKHETTILSKIREIMLISTAHPLTDLDDIRAILLNDENSSARLKELSRVSVIQEHNGQFIGVPAFLYSWACKKSKSLLAYHLKHFFEACWSGIFLEDRKQGKDGTPLEKLLWHHEAIRRDLLGGKQVEIRDFFCLKEVPALWKWIGHRTTFELIRGKTKLEQQQRVETLRHLTVE